MSTPEVLVQRIRALVPTHPEILNMVNPFDLFRIEGFHCADLQPSLAQAREALREVQNNPTESSK